MTAHATVMPAKSRNPSNAFEGTRSFSHALRRWGSATLGIWICWFLNRRLAEPKSALRPWDGVAAQSILL